MNLRTTIAAAALLAAVPAFAASGEATPDYPMDFVSTVTRAEVHEAAIAARHAGRIVEGERNVVAESPAPAKTRAQVIAETREAQRLGLLRQREKNAFPSAAQLEQIRQAGLRAADGAVAAR